MTALDIAPRFTDQTLTPVGDWHPARYTRSLSGTEEFPSDADRLLPVLALVWRSPETDRFLLDPWQVWLLRHMLELYPDDWPVEHLRGQLRYRQLVVSVARQNGKSILAAVLAFYFLAMHVRGPRVIGVASRESQAKIVYDRVAYTVENSPEVAKLLRATKSRGIHRRDGTGQYETLPADEEAAQGEPVTGGIYDELHIGLAALWDAIVLGARSKRNALLAGLTTAGDADSDLLIRLYEDGAAALEGEDERFGFFVWEAPANELTVEGLIAANPAIACGRIELEQAWADAGKLWRAPKDKSGVTGKDRCLRYVLNRFVEGSANSWASLTAWRDTGATEEAELEHGRGVVYALERTDSLEWVTITATSRRPDGRLLTELVATLDHPDQDTLRAVCLELNRITPDARFAVLRNRLKALGEKLKEAGLEVWFLGANEEAEAAATARATIARRAIVHPGDPLMSLQMAQARRRDLGESWRISRTLSTGDVDAVIGTAIGVYVATARGESTLQMF